MFFSLVVLVLLLPLHQQRHLIMDTAERAYEKFQNQMIAFDNLKIEMNELAVDLDQQLSDKQSLILQQEQDHKQKVNDLTNQEYKLKLQAKSLKEKKMQQETS